MATFPRHRSAAACAISAAFLVAVANPSGLEAEPLFDAPYRWFPTSAPVHSVAASPRHARTAAFAVVTHTDQGTVEVLQAGPDGALRSTAVIPVPSHPHGVAIADFDGDGCPDVAAGGFDPPGIVLIHGRCSGKFDPPEFFPCSTSVEDLAVADVDADGYPDLVGSSSAGGVVMLSDQAGGLQPPNPMPGTFPDPVAVGRIDADPYPDIALMAPATQTLTIRLGRGDGTFGDGRDLGQWGAFPRLADLSGDGKLDVVYGIDDGYDDGLLGVLVNDGNGNVNPPGAGCVDPHASSETQSRPRVTTGGDVDGDGNQDVIAVSDSRAGPVLSLLSGSGCGWFRANWRRDVQSSSPGVLADMDGDGRDDFLQPDGAGVSLFMDSASGRFGRQPLGMGWVAGEANMIAAQVDDGPTLDLVVARDAEGLYVEFGSGGGEFDLGSTLAGGRQYFVVADLDLDGHTDVVDSQWPYASITNIWLGDGQRGYPRYQQLNAGGLPGVLRAGRDPNPEVLLLRSDSLLVFRNRGDAVFEPLRALAGGGTQLVVCDLNADGRDDAIIRNGSSLSVRLGEADGLGALAGTATGIGGEIQVADLDGDGRLDVFAANASAPPVWLRGRGDGTLDPPAMLTLPAATSYAFADWNGDGMLDAAFLSSRKVGVAFGTGGASFSAPAWFGTGFRPAKIVAGDLNGDGRPDLAVQDSWESIDGDLFGRIDLLFNNIPAGTPLGVGDTPASPSTTLALGIPSPNPLREGTRLHLSPGAATQVSVRVLDVAGREVRVLLQGATRTRDQVVVWDGRDARGAKVPPGVYLVNARGGSASITRRVVVLQ